MAHTYEVEIDFLDTPEPLNRGKNLKQDLRRQKPNPEEIEEVEENFQSDDEEYDASKYEEEDYDSMNQPDSETFKNNSDNIIDICLHPNSVMTNGVEVCTECGIEIYKELSLEAEWRYYGDNDSKHNSDPSRCHLRKSEEKNIYNDVKDIDLPRTVITEANDLYLTVTEGKIRRGKFRKSLIFACVFNAYKYQSNPQTPEELQEKFDLTKKDISRGLCEFNLKMRKTKKPIYISPANFIPRIMKNKFNANEYHVEKVKELYEKIENKSALLNRSNPQSTVSGLIYYYCRSIGKEISCSKFSEMVKLSDITIGKISKNIATILGTIDHVKLN